MYYNQDSLANIIAMKDMAAIPSVQITMDSSIEEAIIVEVKGVIFKFKDCNDGLYDYNTDTIKTNKSLAAYSFLETVQSNKKFFTQQEIEAADEARLLQQRIGWPSTSYFKGVVSKKLIKNCNITVDDINRADIIYGPPVPLLQGKMIRKKPDGCKIKRIPLPLPVHKYHQDLELYIDVFLI